MVVVKNSGTAQEVICLEIAHKDKNQDVILTFSGAYSVEGWWSLFSFVFFTCVKPFYEKKL